MSIYIELWLYIFHNFYCKYLKIIFFYKMSISIKNLILFYVEYYGQPDVHKVYQSRMCPCRIILHNVLESFSKNIMKIFDDGLTFCVVIAVVTKSIIIHFFWCQIEIFWKIKKITKIRKKYKYSKSSKIAFFLPNYAYNKSKKENWGSLCTPTIESKRDNGEGWIQIFVSSRRL